MICISLYRLFGRYCGRIPAWTLYGSNRTMVVIAHTDDGVTKYGFRAIYQVSYRTRTLLTLAKNNVLTCQWALVSKPMKLVFVQKP